MQKHESAFTLIELMVTIAVAAVVLTLGVPSFARVIERNQLSAYTNQLVSSMHFARSEAVRRNQPITICHSENGSSCGGSGYEEGWLVFVDENNNDDHDSGDELIRVNEGLPSNYTMRTATLSPFSYSAKGRANNGRVVLCKDNQLVKARAIFISNGGRTRLAPLDNSGTPLDVGGTPIDTCNPT
jgi:prepilin-type N-terminal cleavage/methylation domain